MGRKPRHYEDDDGRTIADMSGVERPNLIMPRIPGESRPSRPKEQEPPAQPGFSREEQRMAVLGALKATLLVALPFILGLGLLILLLIWLWK